MTLENKIITRLAGVGAEIANKINSKISAHNSSANAHSDIRENYVKTVDKNKHSHGQITQDGKVTTTTNNTSKVVVTESDGTVKVVNKLPLNNVTHQDLSGKLDKNQGQNNSGKFMKVQSSGDIEPEEITIPGIDVRQVKTNGVEIGSINGTKFYCNENTTYNEATSSNPGLMSTSDKSKLANIEEGAKRVTFSPILTTGTRTGTLTIGTENFTLYCTDSARYAEATPDDPGLMSSQDKRKLNAITPSANHVTFSNPLSTGTQIGTLTIDNQNFNLKAPTPVTYQATGGLTLDTSNNQFKHTNNIQAKTTSSLYKITYDNQGHITSGTPIDTDNLYSKLDHNHDEEYSKLDHRHSSGWRDETFSNGKTSYTYCGITFYTKVNEDLGLGMLRCAGTVTCKFDSSNQRNYELGHSLAGYYPNTTYRTPIHASLNFHMTVNSVGSIVLISDSSSQKDKAVKGGIVYLLGDSWR